MEEEKSSLRRSRRQGRVREMTSVVNSVVVEVYEHNSSDTGFGAFFILTPIV